MSPLRSSLFVFAVLGSGALLAAFSGCTAVLGDFEIAGAEAGAGGAKTNGAACTTNTECGTGFCTDGVCCDSACSGTCESCVAPNAEKGKCSPVPDGVDPDKECAGAARGDAGADPEGDGGDDSGTAINVPEAGVSSDDTQCAGTCNGSRQCKFPAAEKGCGSSFCNGRTQVAKYACNGKGNCEIGLATCDPFVCEKEDCRTSCAAQNDCNKATFCNAAGKCQEKLSAGVACNLPNDCKSGFCSGGAGSKVCCGSDCDAVGGNCSEAGSVGQCKCGAGCPAGVACRLFYRDADGDGFGDRSGTPGNGNAKVGCTGSAPPSGFVTDNTDCADNDVRAKPGQTEFFGTPINGTSSFDFDCDGTVQKAKDEFPGATCALCEKDARGNCTASKSKCQSAGQGAFLSCAPAKSICIPAGSCIVCGGPPSNKYNDGFTTTVACGATAPFTTCGTCGLLGGAPGAPTVTNAQQLCH